MVLTLGRFSTHAATFYFFSTLAALKTYSKEEEREVFCLNMRFCFDTYVVKVFLIVLVSVEAQLHYVFLW